MEHRMPMKRVHCRLVFFEMNVPKEQKAKHSSYSKDFMYKAIPIVLLLCYTKTSSLKHRLFII